MKYISGMICFGIPCREDSVGTWLYTKQDYTDPDNLKLYESDDSIFKDLGIEQDKIIPYHDDGELFNVANHTRAYLDMLANCEFDKLRDVFYDYISSKHCRYVIFRETYTRLSKLDTYKDIHKFMSEEFGNAWMSFCTDALQVRRRVENAECVST